MRVSLLFFATKIHYAPPQLKHANTYFSENNARFAGINAALTQCRKADATPDFCYEFMRHQSAWPLQPSSVAHTACGYRQ
jgi:hypothetical protein